MGLQREGMQYGTLKSVCQAADGKGVKMEGANWMDIRNDRQKRLSYTKISHKYSIDPNTAKKYAESEARPIYSLSATRLSKPGSYNKVNGKVHATTNEILFEALKKEGLNPLKREYIIDKINLRRVQKDCLMALAHP